MTKSNTAPALEDLAKEINEHDAARRACEVKGVLHAIKVGLLLIEVKAIVPHGKFREWCAENLTVTQRMAQIYMKLAKDRPTIEAFSHEYETVSHLTINTAVKLIREKQSLETAAAELREAWNGAQANLAEMNAELQKARRFFADHGGDTEFKKWMITGCGASEALAGAFLETGEITFIDDPEKRLSA